MAHDPSSLNATELLRHVTRLIRIGFPPNISVQKQKEQLEVAFSSLRRVRPDLSSTDQLRITMLEAEYQQQRGYHQRAADLLADTWNQLKPRLDSWSTRNPLEPSRDRKLLRQKLWALLHYVSYQYYRVEGRHVEALELFHSIETIIKSELAQKDYKPFGTLALCNYFMGLCYRVDRGFLLAEQHMLAAQKYTNSRARRELSEPTINQQAKQYKLDYKNVFNARILYGLGYLALQQGHLLQAQQHLCTAQGLLVNLNQKTIRVIIDSLLCITVRRATPYDTPLYDKALVALASQYNDALTVHELSRQRCAFELVRGHLDIVEFGNLDPKRRDYHLLQADLWLNKLGEINVSKVTQRFHVHKIRYLLVTARVSEAKEELAQLRTVSLKPGVRQRAISIMEATCSLQEGNLRNARTILLSTLKTIVTLDSSSSVSDYRVPDPVLEAECYVLLAKVHVASKDYSRAKYYLSRWGVLSQFVKNHYLHRAVKDLTQKDYPFFLEHDYAIFNKQGEVQQTIVSRRDDFERWLVENAVERLPEMSIDDIALKVYGRNPSNFRKKYPDISVVAKSRRHLSGD